MDTILVSGSSVYERQESRASSKLHCFEAHSQDDHLTLQSAGAEFRHSRWVSYIVQRDTNIANTYSEYLDLLFVRPSRFVRIRPLPSAGILLTLYTALLSRDRADALCSSCATVQVVEGHRHGERARHGSDPPRASEPGLNSPLLSDDAYLSHLRDTSASKLPKRIGWSTEI